MRVAEIWRYPVKSMQGEGLDAVPVSERGFLGDRAHALIDKESGKIGSAKNPSRWPKLLDYQNVGIIDCTPVTHTRPVGVMRDLELARAVHAESDAILRYPLRPVEAMKVSHHGSADPGLPQVLDRLRPQAAGIEVGRGNSYGHPAPATMAALRRSVPYVYRTDQDGTVTLTFGPGDQLTARTAR